MWILPLIVHDCPSRRLLGLHPSSCQWCGRVAAIMLPTKTISEALPNRLFISAGTHVEPSDLSSYTGKLFLMIQSLIARGEGTAPVFCASAIDHLWLLLSVRGCEPI